MYIYTYFTVMIKVFLSFKPGNPASLNSDSYREKSSNFTIIRTPSSCCEMGQQSQYSGRGGLEYLWVGFWMETGKLRALASLLCCAATDATWRKAGVNKQMLFLTLWCFQHEETSTRPIMRNGGKAKMINDLYAGQIPLCGPFNLIK